MSLEEKQRRSFEDRLGRIRACASNTMGEVHIGPSEDRRFAEGKPKNRVRVKSRKAKQVKVGEGSNKVLVPVGLVLGVLAMFVGLAATFQLFDPRGLLQLPAPHAALDPYMSYAPFVFGVPLALAFAWTFQLNNLLRRVALIGGLAVGFIYHPQLVDQFPGTHVAAFNKEYVKTVRSDLRAPTG